MTNETGAIHDASVYITVLENQQDTRNVDIRSLATKMATSPPRKNGRQETLYEKQPP